MMRSGKIKVTLSLNVEALGLLDSLVTERKRGEFVSGLIMAHVAQQRVAQQKAGGQVKPDELAERLRELAALVGGLKAM